jgi:hypothetical protein
MHMKPLTRNIPAAPSVIDFTFETVKWSPQRLYGELSSHPFTQGDLTVTVQIYEYVL